MRCPAAALVPAMASPRPAEMRAPTRFPRRPVAAVMPAEMEEPTPAPTLLVGLAEAVGDAVAGGGAGLVRGRVERGAEIAVDGLVKAGQVRADRDVCATRLHTHGYSRCGKRGATNSDASDVEAGVRWVGQR
jgi:hypothetical protein